MLSKKHTACFVWCCCCVRISVCLNEVFAEEGKEWTLNCIGNKTRHLKNIWWTSNGTVLSKCHPGRDRCINYNAPEFTAVQSETFQKYTSRLTLQPVDPKDRDRSFHCEDDGGDYNNRQSFLLRVYHFPHTPFCTAEDMSHGRIKVACETSKVYPNVTCEISQEFRSTVDNVEHDNSSTNTVNTGAVVYKTRPFKQGTTEYYSASCTTIISASQVGTYRFKVKMYPGITNTLVASVDGYTNNVRIKIPAEKDESGRNIQERITEQTLSKRRKDEHKAEALTDHQNSRNRERETIKRDADFYSEGSFCENSKDEVIKRQQVVIMLLTILVSCIFLMTVLPKIRDALCKRSKTKIPTEV